MKKLFLLDGHALVYRSHFAFISRPLTNSKGDDVSAITGFMNTLLELIQREKPTHLAVAFDPHGPTFRDEIYAPYKANREAQPEGISFGLPYINQMLQAMCVPIIMVQGFEADDTIGTIAYQAHDEGFEVYMVTPDKDFGQLVRDGIFMYKPAKGPNEIEILGPKEICEKWAIKSPSQVIDILALQGDTADNIPGVPGIGPKSAAVLLEKYGDLENILSHVHELKGKQQETLTNFAEQARLSYTLATIETKVPITFDAEATRWHTDFDVPRLTEIFRELEFQSTGKRILNLCGQTLAPEITSKTNEAQTSAGPQQTDLFGNVLAQKEQKKEVPFVPVSLISDNNAANTAHNYQVAQTEEEQLALLEKLLAAPSFCIDTETTDIDANRAELVGLSFSIQKGEAWYVPVAAQRAEAQAVVERFRPALTHPSIEKVGQNLKYDYIVLLNYGLELSAPLFDTMLAHYVYEPEMRHNMDYLSEVYLGYKPISISELIGKKGKEQGSMRDVPLEQIKEYAAEDADITLQLKTELLSRLKDESQLRLLQELEIPLVPVLANMEFEGIRLDPHFLNTYAVELRGLIQKSEVEVYQLAGFTFNIGSPKQVGDALFERLELPYKGAKTGKTGQFSTDEERLSELAAQYPVARAVLNWRSLSKLLSTYVEALPKMINPRTGRVHSSFNQALAATGRLSSNNPNLQNIPIKTPEGRKVRQAFLPRDENHVLLSADYSQIELRLIAEICNETAMLEAFQKGLDIHQSTAARVYGVPLEEVTSDQRRNAKTVNFSILYGAGATNVSQQLGIPRAEAKTLIDNYFASYPELRDWMKNVVLQAREDGFVTTLMGRRRYLRDIDSRNGMLRANAERVAVNSPVQGSAADLIKKAMIDIHKSLKDNALEAKLVLQVHDELIFDVPKNELETVRALVLDKMKNALPGLKVPIEVGMGEGNNWLEAH